MKPSEMSTALKDLIGKIGHYAEVTQDQGLQELVKEAESDLMDLSHQLNDIPDLPL